jgi:hypothetical protein
MHAGILRDFHVLEEKTAQLFKFEWAMLCSVSASKDYSTCCARPKATAVSYKMETKSSNAVSFLSASSELRIMGSRQRGCKML